MSSDSGSIQTDQIGSTYDVADCPREDESVDSSAYSPPYFVWDIAIMIVTMFKKFLNIRNV